MENDTFLMRNLDKDGDIVDVSLAQAKDLPQPNTADLRGMLLSEVIVKLLQLHIDRGDHVPYVCIDGDVWAFYKEVK